MFLRIGIPELQQYQITEVPNLILDMTYDFCYNLQIGV